jgi:hypothetical protein
MINNTAHEREGTALLRRLGRQVVGNVSHVEQAALFQTQGCNQLIAP